MSGQGTKANSTEAVFRESQRIPILVSMDVSVTKDLILLKMWVLGIPCVSREMPFGSVASAEAVTYRPIRDFGGWGIRRSWSGDRCYNVKGDQAVKLVMTDGQAIFVGSQQPHELHSAIAGGMQPKAL